MAEGRFWEAIIPVESEIGNKLNNKISEISDILMENKSSDYGLMRGEAGNILALFYYSQAFNRQDVFEQATERLQSLVENLAEDNYKSTYSSGIAGIGWLILHLVEQKFIDLENEEILVEIDRVLERSVDIDLINGNYDYLHGVIGTGLYFIKRRNNKHIINKILDGLIAISVTNKSERAWISNNNKLDKDAFNLSLSHGLAGIILFLCKLAEENILEKSNNSYIKESVSYLLLNRLPSQNFHSYSPSAVYVDKELNFAQKNSRLSWCYGDLGTALALIEASIVCNRDEWSSSAYDILKMTTGRRTFESTAVIDAAICHGSSGIAHIYNRIYNNTRQPIYKEASIYWYNYSLKQADKQNGLAGYQSFFGAFGWKNETGILEGVSGIMLTYMSALYPLNPSWGECFLLK